MQLRKNSRIKLCGKISQEVTEGKTLKVWVQGLDCTSILVAEAFSKRRWGSRPYSAFGRLPSHDPEDEHYLYLPW